jgi:hypothetical protein
VGGYFFFAGKTCNGSLREFSRGPRLFFTSKLSWMQQRAILGSKKSWPPLKNLKKLPFICFAQDGKITSQTLRIRGALVFLCHYTYFGPF